MSSGETEFMALVRGGSIGLGAKVTIEDFGQKFGVDLETDSSAAKGVATRRGVGKTRHLHTTVTVATESDRIASCGPGRCKELTMRQTLARNL